MNKIYKVIWNRARHCYVVVSELTKRAGKEKSIHLTKASRLAVMTICTGALSLGIASRQKQPENPLWQSPPRTSMWLF